MTHETDPCGFALGNALLSRCCEIADPRVERTKRHRLADILFVAVCAILCGADDCSAMADFGRSRAGWLRQFVGLEGGIPSHDTFSRVFSILAPEALSGLFLSWVGDIRAAERERLEREAREGEESPGAAVAPSKDVVNIDGKTSRRSYCKADKSDPLHTVSAFSHAAGLVLGQLKVDVKENEIVAIPNILDLVDVENCIVTIDAMGTQRAIAAKIIEKKGDYLLPVKGNHPDLSLDIRAFFDRTLANRFMDHDAADIPHTVEETAGKGHGRGEVRRCWATAVPEDVVGRGNWKGIKSIAMIESARESTRKEDGEQADAPTAPDVYRRYYITSLPPDAKEILRAARAHWSIENKLHWVLDVVFRDDESRTRKDNGPNNLAVLRHVAFNLCKSNTTIKASVRRKRNMAAWNVEILHEIITGVKIN